jgi:hypothetical protein
MISALNLPIAVLHYMAAIIGGLWLAFLGDWTLVAFGFLVNVTARRFATIPLIPSILLGVAANRAVAEGRLAGLGLSVLASLWTHLVIGAWCGFLFMFMMSDARVPTLPYALWAFSASIGPWHDLPEQPQAATTPITFACLGTALMAAVAAQDFAPNVHAYEVAILGPMVLSFVIQLVRETRLVALVASRG